MPYVTYSNTFEHRIERSFPESCWRAARPSASARLRLISICRQRLVARLDPQHRRVLQPLQAVSHPAQVLGIDRGTLKVGAPADVTIIDPEREWTIEVSKFRSKSRNCPFGGWKVKGLGEQVIVGGRVVQRSSPLV